MHHPEPVSLAGAAPRRVTLLRPLRPTLAALALAALAACGGGGGSSSSTDVPPVTPAALSLHGTAATGKALAGGSVAVKCNGGTGSATTRTDGSFDVSVTGGSLPCAVKVTAADGSVLHSVAAGTGASATVNVSPLTELIVAQAAGGSASDLFANFDAAAQGKVTSDALRSATTKVADALRSVVDIPSTVDPIKDTLVAANGNAAGNDLDKKLDTLTAALTAARVTVAELGTAIVTNGSSAATVVASQVKPAATTCASLRSGDYRIFNPNESSAAFRYRKASIDAAALTLTIDGQSTTATPVDGRACEFTVDAGRVRLVVSPAGVVVQRYTASDGSNQPRMALAFPEQTVALADLAGTWNTVEFNQTNGTTMGNGYAVVTVDAAGKITSGQDCQYLQPCTAASNFPPGFTVNAAGGFDAVNTDGSAGRFFAYRAPSGDVMLVGGDSTGAIVGAKQKAQTLPAVGDVTPYWNISINGSAVASPLIYEISTVSSIDTAAGSFTRTTASDGKMDIFAINTPRNGMRTRAVNGCKTSTGAAGTCSGVILMPLPGMGMVVFGSAVSSNAFFGFSVNRPAGSTGTGTSDGGSTSTGGTGGTAALGTLASSSGQTYALRASLTVNAAGQVTGGQYDWHTLTGTLTPCTYSPELQTTCFGSSGPVSHVSQTGAISTSGASGVTLSIGPDGAGYSFTGTLTGTTWTGTFSKPSTTAVPFTESGSFSVVLAITQVN